jgi:hypothetical protein
MLDVNKKAFSTKFEKIFRKRFSDTASTSGHQTYFSFVVHFENFQDWKTTIQLQITLLHFLEIRTAQDFVI